MRRFRYQIWKYRVLLNLVDNLYPKIVSFIADHRLEIVVEVVATGKHIIPSDRARNNDQSKRVGYIVKSIGHDLVTYERAADDVQGK